MRRAGPVRLALVLAVLGAFRQAPAATPESPPVAPDEVASVPFSPSRVILDGSDLYIVSSSRIARLEKTTFVELPAGDLTPGSSVAIRARRIFISRRQASEIVVLDYEGKLKRRYATGAPPNAIAVDDLGNAHVFSIFVSGADSKAIVRIFDGLGGFVRSAGALPEPSAAQREIDLIERRAAFSPLLRTSSQGDIWFLSRDGAVAGRIGASTAALDTLSLSGDLPKPAAAIEKTDEDRVREERTKATLLEAVQKSGANRGMDPPKVVIPRNDPPRFADFACGPDGCAALSAQALDSSEGDQRSVSVLFFDSQKHVEKKSIRLAGPPDTLVGVGVRDRRLVLYALRGKILLEYALEAP